METRKVKGVKPIKPPSCAGDGYCPDCEIPCPVRVRPAEPDNRREEWFAEEEDKIKAQLRRAKMGGSGDVADLQADLMELRHDRACWFSED